LPSKILSRIYSLVKISTRNIPTLPIYHFHSASIVQLFLAIGTQQYKYYQGRGAARGIVVGFWEEVTVFGGAGFIFDEFREKSGNLV